MTYLTFRHAKNGGMTLLMGLFTLAVLIPLVLIFAHIVKMGVSSISIDFFTQIPKPTGETGGGMANGMVGSALLIFFASCLGIPVGIFGAVYLAEYGGTRISTVIRFAEARLSASTMISCSMIQWLIGAVWACRTNASQPRTDSRNRT